MSESVPMKKIAMKKDFSRRSFLGWFAAAGVAASAFPEALWAQAKKEGKLDLTTIQIAEKVAGVEFDDQEREQMLEDLGDFLESYRQIRSLNIQNDVSPAFRFDPTPTGQAIPPAPAREWQWKGPKVTRPTDDNDLAFMSLVELAELIKTQQITSVELTKLYLKRLKKNNDVLECVITLTGERALEAAARADSEIAAGKYRGPLHGIPWGAKDLLSAKGYPTTWGAMPYKDQVLDMDATVVSKLEAAGAVLVAKLTLGALAWGDYWFGGQTKNPWNVEQGSSGSSAGPGSATAAGLVGFAIGSETWGSIVSPSTRNGVTGLRPTYGRVSRHGAMALSWTMDKLGPMCRSVDDCMLVFDAIHGPDGYDLSVVNMPFSPVTKLEPKDIKIGYFAEEFEKEPEQEGAKEWFHINVKTLETLRTLGFNLVPIKLPDFPAGALGFILSAEAAAAFDELTMSGRDDLMVRQVNNAWPNVFRGARMIPAVEYIQANRARQMLMHKMAEAIKDVDCYVCSPYGTDNLLITNLTGHPCVVMPNGFRKDGTPTSITFNGHLYREDVILAVASAYQKATDFHLKHPDLDKARKQLEEIRKKEAEEKEKAEKEKKDQGN